MTDQNLLFIISDEHQARALSSAGHPIVQTPHIDGLASRGVRFENCYTSCPICVPARASLATGQYTHSIGYWDNAMAYDGKLRSWAHILAENGIRVDSVGKLHFRNDTDPTGFNEQIIPMHIMDGIGAVWGAVRDPLPETPRKTEMFMQIGAGLSKYNEYDLAVTQNSINWLSESERKDAPWMLYAGYVAPHFPLVVPEEFLNMYDPADMPLPKLHPKTDYQCHPWLARMNEYTHYDGELISDDNRRLAIACYYGLCSFLDHQIGRLLEAIDIAGFGGNTTIIYTSDHGEMLGMRGRWGKSVLYRESTEIPLIIAGNGIQKGGVHRGATSLLDLPPTFLEFFGVDIPYDWPGISLQQTLTGNEDLDRMVFSEYHAASSPSGAFMVANARWKYHYYCGYPPELFDLLNDPDEVVNLADDPDHAAILTKMHQKLLDICDPDEVDRQAKADQAFLIERHGGRQKALGKGPPGATPAPV